MSISKYFKKISHLSIYIVQRFLFLFSNILYIFKIILKSVMNYVEFAFFINVVALNMNNKEILIISSIINFIFYVSFISIVCCKLFLSILALI